MHQVVAALLTVDVMEEPSRPPQQARPYPTTPYFSRFFMAYIHLIVEDHYMSHATLN